MHPGTFVHGLLAHLSPARPRLPPSGRVEHPHACSQGEEEDALLVPTGPSQRVRVIEALSTRMKDLTSLLDSALMRENDARYEKKREGYHRSRKVLCI